MLLLENIPHLLDGVTQKTKTQRLPTQAQAQVNGYSDPQDGLRKRPPTSWIATLYEAATYDDNTFIHVINKSTSQRYLVVIENSTLAVFNAETGEEMTVVGTDADSYLVRQIPDTIDTTSFAGTYLGLLTAYVTRSFVAVGSEARAFFAADGTLQFYGPSSYSVQQYVRNTLMPTADYTVTATFFNDAAGNYPDARDIFCIRGRASNTNYQGYELVVTPSTGNLTLYKRTGAGTQTSLYDGVVSAWSGGLLNNVDYTVSMEFSGTNILLYADGVLQTTVSDATYAGPGYVGFGGTSGSSLYSTCHVRSIATAYPAASYSTTTPVMKAATIGDTTVVVNTSVEVQTDTVKSDAQVYEALVFVRQADFGTSYTVSLNGNSATVHGKIGSTAAARDDIATDAIAAELVSRLEANASLTDFEFTRYGSTIHITRTDGEDFVLACSDGLADNALLALKGSVQRFDDLPAIGVDGFIIEVTGDPGSEYDNFWVVYDDLGMPDQAGVWRETIKPGTLTDLDPATMPHLLTLNGGVVPDLESLGETKLPYISATGGGVRKYEGFESTQWTAPRGSNGYDKASFYADSAVLYTTPQDANGLETTFEFAFDVDTRRMASSNNITLIFEASTAASPTVYNSGTLLELQYGPGLYLLGQRPSFDYALEAGARIRVTLTYDLTDSANYQIFPFRLARVTFTGRNKLNVGGRPGIAYEPKTGQAINFEPALVYPDNLVITYTVGGVDYTVAGSVGNNGAEIAAYVAANQTISGYTLTNPSSGVLNIVKGAGTAYTLTIAQTWDNTTHVNVADQDLVASAHVGLTLENLTDGSSATITANTDNSITTAALTGGATNTYKEGDLLRIRYTTDYDYFSFARAPWASRGVGDDITNPFPTFVGDTINDVFFYKNRLGFLSGANVALSGAGDLYNFSRITSKALLDDDFIDVIATSRKTADLHTAVMWNKALYLLSDNAQFSLSGQPILTPKTVAIELVKDYENHPLTTPVTAGDSLFFANMRQDSGVQLMDFRTNADATDGIASSITDHVQTYIAGEPFQLLANADLGFLGVLTRDDRDTMYVCVHREDQKERSLLSWSKWVFPGAEILGAQFVESRIYFVMHRDGYIMLERMSLDNRDTAVDHVDCQMSLLSVTDGGSPEKFIFAYPQFSSTPDVVAVAADKSYAAAAVQGAGYYVAADVAAATKTLGLEYEFSYTFHPLYHQNRQGAPEVRGRLQIRYLKLDYAVARMLTAAVLLAGRTVVNTVLNLAAIASGTMSIPVMGQNEQATITLSDSSPYPVTLTSVDWEGYWHIRNPNRR